MDKWKGWSVLTFAFLIYTVYVTVTFFFMHDYSNRDQIKGQQRIETTDNIEYNKNTLDTKTSRQELFTIKNQALHPELPLYIIDTSFPFQVATFLS